MSITLAERLYAAQIEAELGRGRVPSQEDLATIASGALGASEIFLAEMLRRERAKADAPALTNAERRQLLTLNRGG